MITKYCFCATLLFLMVFTMQIEAQTTHKSKGAPQSALNKPTAKAAPAPLRFEGSEATLQMETWGSAFTSWQFKNDPINPFDWGLTVEQMPKNNQSGPPFKGHFLCLGRWGAPSVGEIAKGIPHNSEANTLAWQVLTRPSRSRLEAKTKLVLPLDQYEVTRTVSGHATGTSFKVEEAVKNLLNTGRIHNIVQHATIGGAFLNPQTLIDCNAGEGFDQRAQPEKLDSMAFTWDKAVLVDGPADLRTVNDDRGYVTTHLLKKGDSLGWITATDPIHNQLIGYVWPAKAYPWLNVWHWKKDGKPHAHGLEFGTCGLGQPYKLLLEKRVQFRGYNMFEYIDAGEVQTRKYMAFRAVLPAGWKGCKDLKLDGNLLTLFETGTSRTVQIEVVGL